MDVKDQACTSPPPIDDIHTVVSPIIKDHTGTAHPPIDDIHTVVSPIIKDHTGTAPPPIDDIHTVVSPIIKDHTGTAPPPIDDIHTVVSPIIKDYTCTAPPPIDDIHTVVSPVIKDHTATFIPAGLDHAQHVDLPTQMDSSSPLLVLGNLTETTPNGSGLRPAQMTSSLGNCFDGSLVEVESFADMKAIPRDAEVRVRQHVINKTINSSCSTGNFAWTLAQRLFNENELFGRNYRGKRGKLALSPRRTHAIEHCVVACYGDNFDNLGESRRAIDTGIRNMKFKTKCRKDLYPL
ncbi:uncharacterized protein [Argopecten irradians]|uniref:uncharacterized protein n=1 Tax=Argopecten irradians TaxID=31199 RepID=UPI00370F8071